MQPFKMLTQHSEIAFSNCLLDAFMYCFFAFSGSRCRCLKSGRKVRMRRVIIDRVDFQFQCSSLAPAFDDGDQDCYKYQDNFDQKQIQICHLDSSLASFGDNKRLLRLVRFCRCVYTMQRRCVK